MLTKQIHMAYSTVKYKIEDGVATIILNKPERYNALGKDILVELHDCVIKSAADDSVKVVLISGAGKAFCAGADISNAPEKNTDALLQQGERAYQGMTQYYNPIIQTIHEMDKPVIAAVNGVTAGYGVSLALCCDMVFAAESASFIQVFVPNLGIVPDGGATWLLPRLTTTARAMGMFLTGEKIKAQQAEDWGMIWKCVPDDELMATAQALATRLSNGPTLGIRSLKIAMNQTHENSLQRHLQLEASLQKVCCGSMDFAEGCMAFGEKRKPKFIGK
jgi:2-(1,2-epoxy-1,2-dihydrophenyl)acetyl-CoA isomerase